jgi:hypothetical protein
MSKKRKLNFYVTDKQALLIDKIQAKQLIETESKILKREVVAKIFRRGCEIIARENGLQWTENPDTALPPATDAA